MLFELSVLRLLLNIAGNGGRITTKLNATNCLITEDPSLMFSFVIVARDQTKPGSLLARPSGAVRWETLGTRLYTFTIIVTNACQIRGLQEIFEVFKYWCFVIAFFWFLFSQNDIECWETGRVMYVTSTEGACLSQADLSIFRFNVLYLLNTFSWNPRERNPEAQMSSNSVSMHL